MSFDITPLAFSEEGFTISMALIWLCRELGRAWLAVVVIGSRLSIQGGEWGRDLLLNNDD